MLGINLSGAEFGKGSNRYAYDYIYPGAEDVSFYKLSGITEVRLPVLWERLQPSLGGAIDPAELGRLRTFLDIAARQGVQVVIDVHNYGRYNDTPIGTGPVTVAAFADFWQKLAIGVAGKPAVAGFDLMNEPFDINDVWPVAAQAAINAIRQVDMKTAIIVEGNSFASAARWLSESANMLMHDPAGNVIYSAHVYFDWDASGRYFKSYDADGADPMVGVRRLQPFLDWIRDNGVRGYIGEFAVPQNDPRWEAVLQNFLKAMADAGVSGAYWGGGPWWGDYPLAPRHANGSAASQLSLLETFATRVVDLFPDQIFRFDAADSSQRYAHLAGDRHQVDSLSEGGMVLSTKVYSSSWVLLEETRYAADGTVASKQHFTRGFNAAEAMIGTDASDAFLTGHWFTDQTEVIGGDGQDILALQGDYSVGVRLGAHSLRGIETVSLLSGNDTRFGDFAHASYGYRLTMLDDAITAGHRLTVNGAALLAGETLTVDGSAESDGAFFIYAGMGKDALTGGAGADVFFFAEGRLNVGDRVVGGDGNDIVVLRGDYSGAARASFGDNMLSGVETISLLSATDSRFFAGGTRYSYDLSIGVGAALDSARMTINAAGLTRGETLVLDGHTAGGGGFRVFSGAGDDQVLTGSGADLIYGGLGADRLEGGVGADTYLYKAAAESTVGAIDQLVGFDVGEDLIDLPIAVSASAAVNTGLLRADAFAADLAAAVDNRLDAFGAVLFHADAGDLGGRHFLVVDLDGDGVFRAGADLVVEMANAIVPGALPLAVFV